MKIVPLSIKSAKKIVADWHRHNRPPLSGLFAIGLEHEGKLIGCAIVGRPVARKLDDGETAEVTRVCTLPGSPRGAVSKLYSACRRAALALGYQRLVTYSLESESGASLRGAGWEKKAILPPRPGWDCKSRPRDPGTVDGVGKIRWETP